jgi:hypothetical protein
MVAFENHDSRPQRRKRIRGGDHGLSRRVGLSPSIAASRLVAIDETCDRLRRTPPHVRPEIHRLQLACSLEAP